MAYLVTIQTCCPNSPAARAARADDAKRPSAKAHLIAGLPECRRPHHAIPVHYRQPTRNTPATNTDISAKRLKYELPDSTAHRPARPPPATQFPHIDANFAS